MLLFYQRFSCHCLNVSCRGKSCVDLAAYFLTAAAYGRNVCFDYEGFLRDRQVKPVYGFIFIDIIFVAGCSVRSYYDQLMVLCRSMLFFVLQNNICYRYCYRDISRLLILRCEPKRTSFIFAILELYFSNKTVQYQMASF